MIENGILVLTTNTFSLAHTEEDINKYLCAADKALELVKKAVETDDIDKLLTGKKIRPVFKRNKDR